MTFLQPFILWGLPLILLPVLIHFINRMRHRSQPWAAMRFLVMATRSSVSHARLRQFLILLFRVLSVTTLIFFLSRPLAGGWLGWALAPAPDAILILLDRSASMEMRAGDGAETRRDQAVRLLADAAQPFEESSHLVLIDSALRQPQRLGKTESLKSSTIAGPSDTAADMPAMLQSALAWLIENRAGTAEIWIGSDFQKSNWQPDDPLWENLAKRFASLPQKIRFRLLAVNQAGAPNVSVAVREAVRRQRADQSELQFVLDLMRTSAVSNTIPLALTLDGARREREVPMEGPAFRWRQKSGLPAGAKEGWGQFALPPDGNLLDNSTFFVYGRETPLRAAIISTDPAAGRLLGLAAAGLAAGERRPASVNSPEAVRAEDWADLTLIVWLGPLPSGETADRLRSFVEEGGVALFLPPGQPDTNRFQGTGWGAVETATAEKPFRIQRYDEEQGPLARSDEGISLPLVQLTVTQRQTLTGAKNVLAAFEDGAAFLARETIGRGEIHFVTTLPRGEWSSLADGEVLVPMVQRLLQSGSRRLQRVSMADCGSLTGAEAALRWETVDQQAPKDPRTQAGVYRSGERLLALNRPALEDDPEMLPTEDARQLFAGLSVQTLQERRARSDALQGEIWRLFLFGMLLFLTAEAWLILPPKRHAQPASFAKTGAA